MSLSSKERRFFADILFGEMGETDSETQVISPEHLMATNVSIFKKMLVLIPTHELPYCSVISLEPN